MAHVVEGLVYAAKAGMDNCNVFAGHDESVGEGADTGETAQQYMMRRVKDWNVAVRERPHELQLWLDFAAFQDEVSKCASLIDSCMPSFSQACLKCERADCA
jgi:hypothetical protein